MRYADFRRWLAALLAAVLLATLGTGGAQAATPASWKDSGFAINANGMKLSEVMEEFGRVYGVRVALSANGAAPVKGRLKADSGAEFLDHLMQPYKFRWFVYNDTLYLVPRDENASKRLEIGEDAVQDAKEALVGLGLFDARFGWGELPDEGIVIVSGPRAYVNLVHDVLLPEEGKAHLKGKQIMVFRLKYASATDRVITSRGQSETVPGVKTILNSLLYGPVAGEKPADTRGRYDVASGKRSRQDKAGRGGARELGGMAAPGERTAREGDDGEAERPGRGGRNAPREERVRIEADPSLNAIMVYDNVSKREMYKGLVAQLDIEPQQIEIEALIVDIERSKLTELGVEWGVRSGNVVGTINSSGADSRGVDLPLPGATMLISNAARFYARLKALESDGQARVLAKPTVLTLDNVAAVLDLNQTAYVPLVGERVSELASVTAGTMLRVVPRIVREGEVTRVRLEVDIEDGALGGAALKSNVTRSTISTQAIVDLQHTLMIGGYHTESVSSNKERTPLLGDIPLFGSLFRSEKSTHSSRERLFLITPRLSGTTGTAALARSRAARLARQIALEDRQAMRRTHEKEAPDGEAAGRKSPDGGAKEARVQDKAGAEKRTEDKSLVDKASQEKIAADKNPVAKRAPEKSVPEKSAPEKSAPDKSSPEKGAPEKGAPEKSAPEKSSPDKRADDKRAKAPAVSAAVSEPAPRGAEMGKPSAAALALIQALGLAPPAPAAGVAAQPAAPKTAAVVDKVADKVVDKVAARPAAPPRAPIGTCKALPVREPQR